MSRIRFMSPYLKGGRDSGKLVNRARYIATRPGVEVLRGEQQDQPATKKQQAYIQRLLRDFTGAEELLEYADYQNAPTQANADTFIRQVQEDFAEPMSRMENYLDYVSHRPGVQMDGEHGLWYTEGKVRNLSQAVREVAEHTGSVWMPVVAIRREDAERLGYNDAESWRQLVCACAPEIARGYKIPLEHLRWYAAFHRKEDSVHIHMVVFSSDPKEGYLTRQGIQQVKSAFGRRIFQQDLLHVYEQKTEYRDTLSRDAERAMAGLIAQMETGQFQNETLERLVLELAQRLQSTKGKKVYGYLQPKTKALVDAIVDELAKDERVAAAYDLWNQMREEVCRTYSEQLPERLPLSRQKEFKAVRNMVIREVLKIGQGEYPIADEMVHMPTPPSTPPAWPTVPKGRYHPQQEATHHQQIQAQRVVSYTDTTRCVLQMFRNMGRIFREQSASDAIQACLHIDRKRRRMLREKRMALGHKADDHEDVSQHQG